MDICLIALILVCVLVSVIFFLLSRYRDDNHTHDHANNDSDLEVGEIQGLVQDALEELMPSVIYGGQEMTAISNYCVICLENFIDGESSRVFPVCKHIFHSGCIDQWMNEHLTCPICRISCLVNL
ncbi:RING/U-box superfamily protein [Melia azedarach]|uniref:RING/U-box superfamily protein n=1 Tax=Melia azedarach TaxID=155640 RepID=A0ACC1YTD1_MELAZ|nr:RING/U-box superfamily protein [Melia azedarach]